MQRAGIGCAVKMLIGDLQIVLDRHAFRVGKPRADDVHGKCFVQLRLSRRPQILDKLWPRFNLRAAKTTRGSRRVEPVGFESERPPD